MEPKPTICYTSVNVEYLDRALVLLESIRATNPSWQVVLVLVDDEESAEANQEVLAQFDEVILSRELIGNDHDRWIFAHDVVEACTAVKGAAMKLLLARSPRAVVYLDPDIYVFRDLESLLVTLSNFDVCLTPHQLSPATTTKSIEDNEIGSLRHGIFNLGFAAVRPTNEGLRFASWWAERLRYYCFNDPMRGLFTDQKWLDHAPVFFRGMGILREPGMNVASWNLDNRRVAVDQSGNYTVNGQPLYFWHFTKATSVGPLMTLRFGAWDHAVSQLWRFYLERLHEVRKSVEVTPWAFQCFSNGVAVPAIARRIYRERQDLMGHFPDPFEVKSSSSYFSWLVESQTWTP